MPTYSTQLVWRQPEVRYLLSHPSGPVGRDLGRRALAVRTAARAQVGVKTGALRASIGINYKKYSLGQSILVGSPLKYALLHHEGSRPHVILPKQGKYLRFVSKGVLVFSTKVDHPGTKPNRYLSDNLPLALL